MSRGRERESGTEPCTLRVFGDYACPFSYLAEPALERLDGDGVRVLHRALELRPAPAPLPDTAAPEEDALWRGTILPLARAMGVPIRQPRIQPRTRKAHEAAAFAARHDRFEAYHRAVFHAYFVEGRDIGRIDVLVALGEALGLEPTELKVALDIDQLTAEIAADAAEAEALGLDSTPAFVTPRETVLGLQPYPVLLDLAHGAADGSATP